MMSRAPRTSKPLVAPPSVKLDEDLSPSVAEPFVAAGYSVATVFTQGWSGDADDVIWPRVVAEGRMFVTADKGFGDIRTHPPGTHPGIILLRADRESIPAYRALATKLLADWDLRDLAGAVAVVTPAGVRVRRPDAGKSRKSS